jgi:hypothetical protein
VIWLVEAWLRLLQSSKLKPSTIPLLSLIAQRWSHPLPISKTWRSRGAGTSASTRPWPIPCWNDGVMILRESVVGSTRLATTTATRSSRNRVVVVRPQKLERNRGRQQHQQQEQRVSPTDRVANREATTTGPTRHGRCRQDDQLSAATTYRHMRRRHHHQSNNNYNKSSNKTINHSRRLRNNKYNNTRHCRRPRTTIVDQLSSRRMKPSWKMIMKKKTKTKKNRRRSTKRPCT